MADIFIEHMVARKKTLIDKIIGVLYVMAFISLNLTFITIDILFVLIPLSAIGGGWLLVRLLRNQWIEYEYIVTNGIVDIDKIIGKRKRKRLQSLDCRNFEIIAPTKGNHYDAYNDTKFVVTLDASSGVIERTRYFAVCPAKQGGKLLLIFEPNDKMLDAFRMYNSRAMRQ